MRHFAFVIVGILLGFAVIEFCGMAVMRAYPSIAVTREMLLGKEKMDAGLNSIPQAFLMYIPRPGLKADGYVQHNEHGYRGPLIPLLRKPGTLRVLFMGGSTTYGDGVQNPEDTYPAQLGRLLQQDPALQGKQVEVINAGLRGGTTAEILNHYLLKYRYYRPDVAVINPGGNDPVAYILPTYHPDYSNMRFMPPQVRPLQVQSRWMMNSRFLSAVIVLLFYPDVTAINPLPSSFSNWEDLIAAKWFKPQAMGEIHKNENAFYNNMSTVVREMKHDGVRVLLLSYQGNPFDVEDQTRWRRCYDYEEALLKMIGEEEDVTYAPFPLERMPQEVWVDPSHLNRDGEKIKAGYVYEFLVPLLQSGAATSGESVHGLRQGNDLVLPLREILPVFDLPVQ